MPMSGAVVEDAAVLREMLKTIRINRILLDIFLMLKSFFCF
jgi:hypothetical protein